VPWTGDEPIQSTVVRMIEDKYPPLKVKRNSVKEFIDARINKKVSSFSDFNNYDNNENDSSAVITAITTTKITSTPSKVTLLKKTPLTPEQKKIKQREAKQSRIVNAREAATEYSISKKYPTDDDFDIDDTDDDTEDDTEGKNKTLKKV
ncbi:1644_t:CDS:1, partial [Ambispora leptoticha]